MFFKGVGGFAPLFAMPRGGGPQRQVLECVWGVGFTVGRAGVYHYGCDLRTLYLLDPATGSDRLLARMDGANGWAGLAVTLDGRTIVHPQWVSAGSGLMMIENLR